MELCLVVDQEHNNACDWCGDHIKAGEQYYATPDDHYILCSICGMNAEVKDAKV